MARVSPEKLNPATLKNGKPVEIQLSPINLGYDGDNHKLNLGPQAEVAPPPLNGAAPLGDDIDGAGGGDGGDGKAEEEQKEPITFFVIMLTVLAAVGGFLFGYDTGVISGAMILLKEHFRLSTLMQEIIVSITIFGAAVFSFVGGWLNDIWGRKPVILLASFIFTIGAVIMGVAWAAWVLLVGRLVVGIGIGLVSMTVPVYLAEISPARIRGQLVTVNQLMITSGILVAALVDAAFINDRQNGWRYMLGLAAVPSFLQLVGFLFVPDSPRFLISKQRYEAARKALHQVMSTKDKAAVEQRLQVLTLAYTTETDAYKAEQVARSVVSADAGGSAKVRSNVFWNIAATKPVRRALIVGCLLQLFQQIIGINTVMYYSATIIQLAGVQGASLIVWLAALVAAVNFLCTFIGIYLVERIGRRPLTLISLVGITASLLILAIGFHLMAVYSPPVTMREAANFAADRCTTFSSCDQCQVNHCGYCYTGDYKNSSTLDAACVNMDHEVRTASYGRCVNMSSHHADSSNSIHWLTESCPTRYSVMAIVGLALYLVFFAPGMGPMPWTINSEIYPTWARSTCNALATTTNWIFNLIISFTFLSLTEAITKYGAFYLYAGFCVAGFVFVWFFVPETGGKSLEHVQELFEDDDKFWRRFPRSCCRRRSRRAEHDGNRQEN